MAVISSNLSALTRNTEENEEEEEEIEKSSISSRDSSLSALNHLSFTEISHQMSQCLKLNAENKISDKNAFQLRMIDYLIYTLKNEDPHIKLNLNKASACLDASGKIYALRVDKLHSDVIKVTGSRGEKRKNSDDEEQAADQNNNDKRHRKKRKKTNITTSADCLKGNPESFNPLSFINDQIEAQTSDKLLQAHVLQHANQSSALNHYNYVVLDKLTSKPSGSNNVVIPMIDDFSNHQISPSFAEFKFTAFMSSDSEPEDEVQSDDPTEFHFDFNDSSNSYNSVKNNGSNLFENEDDQNNLDQQEKESIIDFKSVIEKDPKNYEYSYMQANHNIEWIGPSHWKLKFNKRSRVNEMEKVCKEEQIKGLRISFCKTAKKKAEENFVIKMKNKTNNMSFEDDEDLLWPVDASTKNFFTFFLKQTINNEPLCVEIIDETCRDDLSVCSDVNLSDFVSTGIQESNSMENILERSIQLDFSNSNNYLQNSNQAFVGDNLVLAPKLIEKIFIPYSQRAKRIDMKLLKKCIVKSLKIDLIKKVKLKNFSSVYKELSKNLPSINAKSLTPSLAFVSLLHVMHENSLSVIQQPSLDDFTIQSIHENSTEDL